VHSVKQSSRLPIPADVVWARAVTEEGINDELRPLLRMTFPRELRGLTIDEVEVGVPLGRSWILLGGVLPVDYDDLLLAALFRHRHRRLARHHSDAAPPAAGQSS
jgi:hypothetical protein